MSSENGFTIRYGDAKFFIPANYVVESVSKNNSELVIDVAKPYFEHRGQKIKIYRLSSLLPDFSGKSISIKNEENKILIIEYLGLKFGLIADDVLGFSSKVVKPVPVQLNGIREVEGLVIDENYDLFFQKTPVEFFKSIPVIKPDLILINAANASPSGFAFMRILYESKEFKNIPVRMYAGKHYAFDEYYEGIS